jgi:hypothetical protein
MGIMTSPATLPGRSLLMTDPVSIYEAWFVPAVFAPLAR